MNDHSILFCQCYVRDVERLECFLTKRFVFFMIKTFVKSLWFLQIFFHFLFLWTNECLVTCERIWRIFTQSYSFHAFCIMPEIHKWNMIAHIGFSTTSWVPGWFAACTGFASLFNLFPPQKNSSSYCFVSWRQNRRDGDSGERQWLWFGIAYFQVKRM